MSDWFYVEGTQQRGPVSIESLRQLAASGQLRAGDMVWSEGMPAWQQVAQVPGMFPSASGPPPLPPRAVPVGYATPMPYSPQAPSLGDDAGARWLLPVGRSGWAIAAGYLGLFAVLLVPAPLALICGVIAIRDIKRNPRRHGMGRAIFGLVMGIIFSVALCFLLGSMVMSSRRW